MQALLEILRVLLRGLMNTEIQRHQEDEFKMLQYSLVVFCAKKKSKLLLKSISFKAYRFQFTKNPPQICERLH